MKFTSLSANDDNQQDFNGRNDTELEDHVVVDDDEVVKKKSKKMAYEAPSAEDGFPWKEMAVLLLVGFSSALVLTGPFPYGERLRQ